MVHNLHYNLPSCLTTIGESTSLCLNLYNSKITGEPALSFTPVALIGPWSCDILAETRRRRGGLKDWRANGLSRPLLNSKFPVLTLESSGYCGQCCKGCSGSVSGFLALSLRHTHNVIFQWRQEKPSNCLFSSWVKLWP